LKARILTGRNCFVANSSSRLQGIRNHPSSSR
jgi:hypothetical protein